MESGVIKITQGKFHTPDLLVLRLNRLIREDVCGVTHINYYNTDGSEKNVGALCACPTTMRLHIHYTRRPDLSILLGILAQHLSNGETIAFIYKNFNTVEPEVYRLYRIDSDDWNMNIVSLNDFLDKAMINSNMRTLFD